MQFSQPVVISPPMLADGATLTTAATATMFAANSNNKFTLPNNYWYPGRRWRSTLFGRISSVITTPGTARFDMRMGSVVAFDSLAILLDTVAAHVNVPWKLVIETVCRTVGAVTGTTLFSNAIWTCEDILGTPATAPKGSLSAVLPWNTAPAPGTGFDNTLANALDFQFTQTAATGSLTLHDFIVEELN